MLQAKQTESSNHLNQSNIKKQNPMKAPKINASRLLFEPIFPINAFIPGTEFAAPTMRRLILASVSRWRPKFSLIAYA